MRASVRRRIRFNRHLRAEPGRKRAYRVAKCRGDLDGVLRALYGRMTVYSPEPMFTARIMMLEPAASAERKALAWGGE